MTDRASQIGGQNLHPVTGLDPHNPHGTGAGLEGAADLRCPAGRVGAHGQPIGRRTPRGAQLLLGGDLRARRQGRQGEGVTGAGRLGVAQLRGARKEANQGARYEPGDRHGPRAGAQSPVQHRRRDVAEGPDRVVGRLARIAAGWEGLGDRHVLTGHQRRVDSHTGRIRHVVALILPRRPADRDQRPGHHLIDDNEGLTREQRLDGQSGQQLAHLDRRPPRGHRPRHAPSVLAGQKGVAWLRRSVQEHSGVPVR